MRYSRRPASAPETEAFARTLVNDQSAELKKLPALVRVVDERAAAGATAGGAMRGTRQHARADAGTADAVAVGRASSRRTAPRPSRCTSNC